MAAIGALRNAKLHLYSHCPFCVRVELVLGWLQIPYERVVYGYGDMSLKEAFGAKMLPVLQAELCTEAKKATVQMKESLDIVRLLDTLPDGAAVHASLAPATGRFGDWIGRMKPYQRTLCRPRITHLPEKDWATPEDVEYARAKYSKQGFDYEAALTPAVAGPALTAMTALLVEVGGMIASEQGANKWGRSMDDVILLPELRTLTCVKGLEWPAEVRSYLDFQFKGCGAPLYDGMAI